MKHLSSSNFRQFIKSHRKLVIILASVFGVLLVAGSYGIWSVSAWQSYDRQMDQALGGVHGKLDKALRLGVKDDQSKATKLAALEGIKTDIEQFEKSCEPSSLLAWQTSFEGIKKLKDKCDHTVSSLKQLQEDLGEVISYLRDEKEVTDIIKPLGGDVELDETKWQGVSETWQQASQRLGEVKVGNAFKPTHGVLKERLQGVEASWSELLAAHEAKDKARFEKATDELMKAYGTFKAASDDTIGIFKAIEDSLAKTYQATF